MSEFAQEILSVNIEDELKQSYLDYAMSVIVGRALPDVRDGLKPVHRRVLFAMYELGNEWNKAYKKSARIVGDVIGKYHPHGDTAVYDALVRMAQPFSMRYVLIDGQGNFGSVDGDSPAAMRYTEVRMSKLTQTLLSDLDKETVDFVPNYDGTEFMPFVLPTRIPNLLVNGSSGIAVGMATNIPPHNLNEVIKACLALIDNPEINLDQLMQLIPGPDFPTAGMINGRAGIVEAYKTGRGRISIRAKTHVEEKTEGGKQSIIVTELPYQVNKARLLEKIAELVKEKIIDGITGLRDESDKDGMRVVIELRRGEQAEIVLNNLYTHTQLQVVFGINMVALENGQPKLFNLKQLLDAFIRHRREVVTRRTIFDLNKARSRVHILEGLTVALANIDDMIALIKAAKNPAAAKEGLLSRCWQPGSVIDLLKRANEQNQLLPEEKKESVFISGLTPAGYQLSPEQAQAILELRLHRLTGLEQEKIVEEYQSLLDLIAELLAVLNSTERLMQIIRRELEEIQSAFGDARMTEIIQTQQDLSLEDLITEEDMVVTLSHEGYAKIQPVTVYRAQKRGGRGKAATQVKEEDFVERLVVANSHDTLLCFSNQGKVYWLKVYQLPQAERHARGKPMVNLLPLGEQEKITAILPVKEFTTDRYVFMVTAQGTVKKVALEHFSKPRASGIIALELAENDRLINADITNGDQEIMLFSDTGKVIRFHEKAVRAMGRTAHGVRGMRLQTDQSVVALVIVKDDSAILTATEQGYGKRTAIEEYRVTGRGGQGVISIQVNDRNGRVIGAIAVQPQHEIMLITDQGTLVRTRVEEVSLIGRSTQGVRLINLSEAERLIGLAKVEDVEEDADVAAE
ncbi:MAG: DNA gyrase subunit A [Gammaproteobacteria bacterium GWF2_41_13]|nr:MAG: DNA gyrase subunit A [Gammaproteobacteria bacterium GWF2_41_13]